ncbi:hypothetical protein HUX57_09840 [Arcobacter butzleri]|uniref:hypothetical protein n=1 Tax=Aliarcobacter butzleri TaxID=28197 RepID=UPI00158791CD|nr:hypothetical protein [Aliarcobacter butzleri]NUW26967.1 hypothetical protein [Aliarcobacter butzleri]
MTINEFFNLSNIRDFSNVISELERSNIDPIELKVDNCNLNNFDNIIKEFYGISAKNSVFFIKNFFIYNKEEKVGEDTFFDINELIELQSSEEIKKEVVFEYVKHLKYGSEMVEPINFIKNNSSNTLILTGQRDNKLKLYKYIFKNNNNEELEIIIPGQFFKNPIYGLLHYINFDISLFRNKKIKIDKYIKFTTTCDYANLFSNLELEDYEYELRSFGIEENIKLTFYKIGENMTKDSILLIQNNKDFFQKLYIINKELLKSYLDRLHHHKKKLYFYYEESNNCIAVRSDNQTIRIENNLFLLRDIIEEILCKKTILNEILEYLKNFGKKQYYFYDDIVSRKDFHFNKYKFLSIIRKVF